MLFLIHLTFPLIGMEFEDDTVYIEIDRSEYWVSQNDFRNSMLEILNLERDLTYNKKMAKVYLELTSSPCLEAFTAFLEKKDAIDIWKSITGDNKSSLVLMQKQLENYCTSLSSSDFDTRMRKKSYEMAHAWIMQNPNATIQDFINFKNTIKNPPSERDLISLLAKQKKVLAWLQMSL